MPWPLLPVASTAAWPLRSGTTRIDWRSVTQPVRMTEATVREARRLRMGAYPMQGISRTQGGIPAEERSGARLTARRARSPRGSDALVGALAPEGMGGAQPPRQKDKPGSAPMVAPQGRGGAG